MANAAPATVTITGSTGPGQAVTTLKFTDVVDVEESVCESGTRSNGQNCRANADKTARYESFHSEDSGRPEL